MRAIGVLSQPRGAARRAGLGLLLAGCGSAPKPAPDRPSSRAARAIVRSRRRRRRHPARPRQPARRRAADRADPPAAAPTSPTHVLGRDYVPITRDSAFSERGLASWYGKKFHGRRTANGEVYDMYAMTAAHPTLPLPSYARIRNPGQRHARWWCASTTAGRSMPAASSTSATRRRLRLDLLRGVAPVELERITFDEIRAGSWRRGGEPEATRLAAATPARARQGDERRARCAGAGACDRGRAGGDAAGRAGRRAAGRRTRGAAGGRIDRAAGRRARRRRRAAGSSSSAPSANRPAPRASSAGSATRSSGWCRCSRPSATRPCTASRPAPMRAAPTPRRRRRGCARRSGWCR